MLINEVIPKAQVNPLSPAIFKVQGYNTYMNFDPECANLGSQRVRGICVYVKEHIACLPISMPHTQEVEILLMSLQLKGSDSLRFGCLYRSPSSCLKTSTLEICKLLKEACEGPSSHLLLAGDFNYPSINWDAMSSPNPPDHPPHLFLE